MTATIELGRRLYAALNAGDVAELQELWSADFRGDLTPGLPMGRGLEPVQGRDAMLAYFGAVGQDFAVHPEVDEIVCTDRYIVGRGHYVGTAVASGNAMRARFIHLWSVEGDVITGVFQATDTVAWERAAAPDPQAVHA
ncbi:MAG: nuclear transport factor 2 family protein [Pseudonocardia sp.]|nr:nuclear transport factor 2 family protein [Pseudonocardia sp.]